MTKLYPVFDFTKQSVENKIEINNVINNKIEKSDTKTESIETEPIVKYPTVETLNDYVLNLIIKKQHLKTVLSLEELHSLLMKMFEHIEMTTPDEIVIEYEETGCFVKTIAAIKKCLVRLGEDTFIIENEFSNIYNKLIEYNISTEFVKL